MTIVPVAPFPTVVPSVRVLHGGEERIATPETWQAVADELVAKHGPGVPRVERIAAAKAPAPVPVAAGAHDVIGEARSTVDFEAAVAAGFAPAQSIYRRGTRVVDLGIENASASRQVHNALPAVKDACSRFESMIAAEGRSDVTIDVAAIRLTKEGHLALPAGKPGFGPRVALSEHAFVSMVNAQHAGIGGGAYLAKCWPELRAVNVNHWIAKIAADEIAARNALPPADVAKWEPRKLTLRTRAAREVPNTPKREIFGVVSPSYTAFDVDKIAQAVALAMPGDAKADITYDGRRASFDVRFHSDVRPEHYVAGEFFKAGLRVRTDDTGSGSISVSSTVFQNLCLNLIVIDEQSQGLARIRHLGSVHELAKKLRGALEAGKNTLAHFLKAWGYACEDHLETLDAENHEVPIKIEDALPGIFNALIERELVPARGARATVIEGLVTAWGYDASAAAGRTRGAIVNAITRYAHAGQSDPWFEDELERAAGRIAYSRRPLPFLPVDA